MGRLKFTRFSANPVDALSQALELKNLAVQEPWRADTFRFVKPAGMIHMTRLFLLIQKASRLERLDYFTITSGRSAGEVIGLGRIARGYAARHPEPDIGIIKGTHIDYELVDDAGVDLHSEVTRFLLEQAGINRIYGSEEYSGPAFATPRAAHNNPPFGFHGHMERMGSPARLDVPLGHPNDPHINRYGADAQIFIERDHSR